MHADWPSSALHHTISYYHTINLSYYLMSTTAQSHQMIVYLCYAVQLLLVPATVRIPAPRLLKHYYATQHSPRKNAWMFKCSCQWRIQIEHLAPFLFYLGATRVSTCVSLSFTCFTPKFHSLILVHTDYVLQISTNNSSTLEPFSSHHSYAIDNRAHIWRVLWQVRSRIIECKNRRGAKNSIV